MHIKHLSKNAYVYVVAVLIALAALLRVLLVLLGWPPIDSDEGTMGIMALHIAYHGQYPLFYYGQGYMGSLEAYLAAIFFQLLGPSVLTLRLGVILMYVGFLLNMYLLTSLLYTKRWALITLVLLALGPNEVIFHQVEAAGGYPETLLFGSLLLLYASWLALTSRQNVSTARARWRLVAYAGFGAIVGLAIWSDFLILPFVVMASLLIVVFCLREMRITGILCMLAGFFIVMLPMIIYNFTVPLKDGSLSFLSLIVIHDPSGHLLSQPSLLQKIAGTLLVGLPVATGVTSLCPILPEEAWPLSAQSSSHTLFCTAVHGGWGLGYLILWTLAAVMAARHYLRLRRSASTASQPTEARQAAIRQFARLIILASAGLTLLIFLLSAPAALSPWPGSRYLVGLSISLPAVLAPLWGMTNRAKLQKPAAMILQGVRWGLLLLVGIIFLLGTSATFARTSGSYAKSQQQVALVHDLMHIGATHIYSDYWTCDRIAFQSQEQIICSVLDEQLQTGLNRYAPYHAIVSKDTHAAYVFTWASPQAHVFASKAAASPNHYQRFVFDGYVIFQPT